MRSGSGGGTCSISRCGLRQENGIAFQCVWLFRGSVLAENCISQIGPSPAEEHLNAIAQVLIHRVLSPSRIKFGKVRLGKRGFLTHSAPLQYLHILAVALLPPMPAQNGRAFESGSVALMLGARRV